MTHFLIEEVKKTYAVKNVRPDIYCKKNVIRNQVKAFIRHSLQFFKLQGRAIGLRSVALLACLLCACSQNQDPSAVEGSANSVTDAVSYEVSGVSDEVLMNVETALSSMPAVSKKNSYLFIREMREKSQRALRALGYYAPKIKIIPPEPKGDLQVVKVRIESGKPVFVRECNIELGGEGARFKSFRRIIEESGLKSYQRLDHGRYDSLKTALKEHALSLGFMDYKVIVSQITVYEKEGYADVSLLADTGKRYSFGPLIADESTLELLKPSRTLFKIEEGTPYSNEALKKFQQDMARTGFYAAVDVRSAVEKKKDFKIPVELHLQRKSKNLMRTGIGYSTDEDLRVLFAWDKPLLNERGHSLSTYARVSSVKQNAEAVYKIPRKDPNLDYYYLRLAQTHTDFNDTKSDLSHVSLHYVADMTGKWRRDYSLRAELEDYTQGYESDRAFDVMPALLLSRRESSGGFDPAYGYSVAGDFTGATTLWSDYNFFRALVSMQGIMSPTPSSRFIFRLTGGGIFGNDSYHVPPSLRFFAGGDRSIRGFGYMSQAPKRGGKLRGGRYLATGTAELQFPIGISSSRAAVFLDAGKAFDEVGTGDLLLGPGIGYRYLSKYGTASVDMAVGVSDEDHGFKLHFSFGPEF